IARESGRSSNPQHLNRNEVWVTGCPLFAGHDMSTLADRLAVVRFAQFVGLRLSEIKWLLNDVPGRPPPERWRRLARQRLTQIDTLMVEIGTVRELLQMTLDHKCPKLVEHGSRLPEGRRHCARYG